MSSSLWVSFINKKKISYQFYLWHWLSCKRHSCFRSLTWNATDNIHRFIGWRKPKLPILSMSESRRKYSQFVRSKCHNASCADCMLMNELNQCTITGLGFKCNERLTAMLEMAPLITECLNTGDIPEDGRIQLSRAFKGILNRFSYFYLIHLFNYLVWLGYLFTG